MRDKRKLIAAALIAAVLVLANAVAIASQLDGDGGERRPVQTLTQNVGADTASSPPSRPARSA